MTDAKFDVFLSHNSRDKPSVRELMKQLLAYQNLSGDPIQVWYDEDQLQPGLPWQERLEHGIQNSLSVAVLIGKDGLGPWEDEEMRGALQMAANDKRPVIPVLLPGAHDQPKLPMFLGIRTWVDLRSGFEDVGLEKLVWGITGKKPERLRPTNQLLSESLDSVLLAYKQEFGPSNAKPLDVDMVLQRHAAHWKKLLGSQAVATSDGSPRSPLAGLQRRLRDLRLDRYVWSGLAWEDPTRNDEKGRPLLTQLSGQDSEPALTVLSTLLDAKNAKNVVLYDDAGMGKTAFTHKLIELLIDSAAKLPELRGKLPLVVRLEGKHEQLDLLLRVCGLLAFQMMLEEKYNASVDNHEDASAVRSFLERARARFLSGARSSGSESAVESTHESWRWAEWMLEKIEFSHRGDIDSFNAQCRSFRDRKTMEWYAALYLMKYATTDDLRQKIAGAGDRCAADFAFDREWLSNCWRQAIDMPRDLVQGRVAIQSLGVLFQRPDPNRTEQTRPCELMWRAWERWLEPPNQTRDAGPSAAVRPLPGAADLIADFRKEFRTLCDANNELALSLQFVAARERPDMTMGNKTQDGQYRLIPPNAASTTFQGERPAPVTISAFWLRKFVVTNAEYRLFDPYFELNLGDNFGQPDRPVVGVDWYAAVMFCRWLGAAYCLPTEAQWEAACRANETAAQETEFWFGEESQSANHAWFWENAERRTHSLAESVQAGGHDNPWGLYDMHGNVWEWCQDWYGAYVQAAGQINPQGPELGSYRVYRGGGWGISAWFCRSAYRYWDDPSFRFSYLGFRVALSSSGQVRLGGASSVGP
jgi:formylglycine-generating enzyme required for sulfatase activity